MNRLLIALFCLLLALPAFTREMLSDGETEEIVRNAAADPVAAADQLSRGWRPDAALRVLTTHADSSDPAVLWRMARARINLAERLDQGDEEAVGPLYEAALANARRAVERDPDNADAHLMIATAAGRVALMKGPFSAAGLVKDVHRHAHLALAHADSIPVAHYILGKTHRALMEKSGLARAVAGLTFASEDSIAYYFERALEVSGGNMIQTRVDYAEFLLEKDRQQEGRQQLNTALALPLRDENDAKAKDWARELLR